MNFLKTVAGFLLFFWRAIILTIHHQSNYRNMQIEQLIHLRRNAEAAICILISLWMRWAEWDAAGCRCFPWEQKLGRRQVFSQLMWELSHEHDSKHRVYF